MAVPASSRPILRTGADWIDITGAAIAGDDVRTLIIDVNEQCTASRDPQPFLNDPVIIETAEAITIYGTTTPMAEPATCPGNPTVQQTIELERPLGKRVIRDGAAWPP